MTKKGMKSDVKWRARESLFVQENDVGTQLIGICVSAGNICSRKGEIHIKVNKKGTKGTGMGT